MAAYDCPPTVGAGYSIARGDSVAISLTHSRPAPALGHDRYSGDEQNLVAPAGDPAVRFDLPR